MFAETNLDTVRPPVDATNQTPDKAAPAKDTTYLAFEQTEGGFEPIGEFTVRSGRSDLAKQAALEVLAERYPDATSLTVAVVPANSWKPETFQLEAPKPRFVKSGS